MKKFPSLSSPVTFGALSYIFSASVWFTPFVVFFLVGFLYYIYPGSYVQLLWEKYWIYNPNIPMRMRISPHVFGLSNLSNVSFL